MAVISLEKIQDCSVCKNTWSLIPIEYPVCRIVAGNAMFVLASTTVSRKHYD